MLGWEIVVTNKDQKIASWMVGISGTDWLEDLVKQGVAKDLTTNNGYPNIFSLPAKVLIPILLNGIPQSDGGFVIGENYVISGNKVWDLDIKSVLVDQCSPDIDLLIEAWDQS